MKVVMNAMTDAELVQAYAERDSEPAFAELVNRHLGFVYASALRQVQRPDVAADVAQAVFLLLAQSAGAAPGGSSCRLVVSDHAVSGCSRPTG